MQTHTPPCNRPLEEYQVTKKRIVMRLDLKGHPSDHNSYDGVCMIAVTYGKLESGLVIHANQQYFIYFLDLVQEAWLRATDERQQAGQPVVSRTPHTYCYMWLIFGWEI